MKNRAIAVALPALYCAVTAHAELSVTVNYDGAGRGSYQSVQVKGSLNWDDATQANYYNLNSREHLWSGNDGSAYITYCVQIYAGIPEGETTFDIVDIEEAPESPWPGAMGPIRSTLLESMFAAWVDPMTGGVYDQGSSSASNDLATAFQLLTWEVTHESFEASSAEEMVDQIDFDRGAIKWASDGAGVQLYMTEMIDLLQTDVFESAPIVGLVSDTAQDQALYVPAPGVLAILGMGLFGTARRRRS